MDDFIMRTNDFIKVTIPPPTIVPILEAPVPLIGTSTSVTAVESIICLLGDELPPVLRVPLPYTAPPFVTPGTGMLSVTLLPANQTQQTTNGKKILIKGGQFPAKFTVESPAMQPTPGGPVPDPVAEKPGTAEFITSNATVKAG